MRSEIENPVQAATFQARRVGPVILESANLGAVQLNGRMLMAQNLR